MNLHEIIEQINGERDFSKAILLVQEHAKMAFFHDMLKVTYLGDHVFSDIAPRILASYKGDYRTQGGRHGLMGWEQAWIDLRREASNGQPRSIRGQAGWVWNTIDVLNSKDADWLIRIAFKRELPFDKSLLVLVFPGINDPKSQGVSGRPSEAPGS